MSDDDQNASDKKLKPEIIAFPHSRVSPQAAGSSFNDLGHGKMSEKYGIPREQLSGHWCSRCEGIWFGYLLEVECPKCGNRHG